MASGWTTLLDFDLFRRSCFNLKTDWLACPGWGFGLGDGRGVTALFHGECWGRHPVFENKLPGQRA